MTSLPHLMRPSVLDDWTFPAQEICVSIHHLSKIAYDYKKKEFFPLWFVNFNYIVSWRMYWVQTSYSQRSKWSTLYFDRSFFNEFEWNMLVGWQQNVDSYIYIPSNALEGNIYLYYILTVYNVNILLLFLDQKSKHWCWYCICSMNK